MGSNLLVMMNAVRWMEWMQWNAWIEVCVYVCEKREKEIFMGRKKENVTKEKWVGVWLREVIANVGNRFKPSRLREINSLTRDFSRTNNSKM